VNLLGTMTAGGLDIEVTDGKIKIVKEGKIKKFVNKIPEITFSGDMARKTGQIVRYITERCVFSLHKDGLALTEVAPWRRRPTGHPQPDGVQATDTA
jgi:acyl CoA:acetate/3-ketoacid CoA transferase